MATLTGTKISDTYEQLIKLDTETLGADASAKYLETGKAENLPISVSTTRVGIGNTAPISLLHIRGADPVLYIHDTETNSTSPGTKAFIAFTESDSGGNTEAAFRCGQDTKTFRISFCADDNNGAGSYTDYLTIDANTNPGFVGIGTVNPSQLLHVEGSAASAYIAQFYNSHSTTGNGVLIKAGDDGDVYALRVQDYNAANELFNIKANGDVGIGIVSGGATLEVSDSSGDYIARFTNTAAANTSDVLNLRVQHDSPTNAGYWLALQDSGASSYETEWGVRGDGTDDGATIYDRSDRRLKDNIVDIPDAISVVTKLKPRNFTWNIEGRTNSGIVRYGFIADEYDEVFPEYVDGKRDSDGKLIPDAMKSDGETIFRQMLSDKPMIALLTKAIQELSAKVTALENA